MVNVPGKNGVDSQLGAHQPSERNESLQDSNPGGLEQTTSAVDTNVSFNSLKCLFIYSNEAKELKDNPFNSFQVMLVQSGIHSI